ncbi:MAG TPA: hypothetical protein PLO89_12310 [Spirochaetota bacterium]|nr:hypothetical protein [Spirochaetota bacterium]
MISTGGMIILNELEIVIHTHKIVNNEQDEILYKNPGYRNSI